MARSGPGIEGIDLPFVLSVRAARGSVTAKNFPGALNEAFEGAILDFVGSSKSLTTVIGICRIMERFGCERLRIWRQKNLQKKA
jgi:hypothetical protein